MRYVLVRMAGGAFILLGVSLIAFFLPALNTSPKEIAIFELGNSHGVTAAEIQRWIQLHGLDQPLWVQYWHWLLGAVHGDFGVAYRESNEYRDVSVNAVVHDELWWSVWLIVPATLVSILIAIPVGLIQAVRRSRPYDHVMTTLSFVVYSTPTFFVCLLLSWYVAVKHHIGTPTVDPAARGVSGSQVPSYIGHHFEQFLLPYVAIVLLSVGGLTRFTRGSAVQARAQTYVLIARAKGAGRLRVLFRHLLRPSVIPLIPIVGLSLPVVLSGAIVVEGFFNVPGMGAQLLRSTTLGDYTVVTALFFLAAVLVVAGNLVAHVCTALVDPRVRRTAAR